MIELAFQCPEILRVSQDELGCKMKAITIGSVQSTQSGRTLLKFKCLSITFGESGPHSSDLVRCELDGKWFVDSDFED